MLNRLTLKLAPPRPNQLTEHSYTPSRNQWVQRKKCMQSPTPGSVVLRATRPKVSTAINRTEISCVDEILINKPSCQHLIVVSFGRKKTAVHHLKITVLFRILLLSAHQLMTNNKTEFSLDHQTSITLRSNTFSRFYRVIQEGIRV